MNTLRATQTQLQHELQTMDQSTANHNVTAIDQSNCK